MKRHGLYRESIQDKYSAARGDETIYKRLSVFMAFVTIIFLLQGALYDPTVNAKRDLDESEVKVEVKVVHHDADTPESGEVIDEISNGESPNDDSGQSLDQSQTSDQEQSSSTGEDISARETNDKSTASTGEKVDEKGKQNKETQQAANNNPPTTPSNPQEEQERISGVVLTFDDNYADQWHSFLYLNNVYGAKATFYVCYPNRFTEEQLGMLLDLQAANNEIGYHTLDHVNSVQYVQENSLESFIEIQILSGVQFLREKGFNIQSFAYPFGVGNKTIDRELLKHFKNLRYTAYTTQNKRIADVDRAYICNSKPQITYAIGIDNVYGISLEDIYRGIDRACENNEILMLYAHGISDNGDPYVTSMDRLEKIAQYVVEKNMRFYTVSELNH